MALINFLSVCGSIFLGPQSRPTSTGARRGARQPLQVECCMQSPPFLQIGARQRACASCQHRAPSRSLYRAQPGPESPDQSRSLRASGPLTLRPPRSRPRSSGCYNSEHAAGSIDCAPAGRFGVKTVVGGPWGAMTQHMTYDGAGEKNKVCVAVRFRPLRCVAGGGGGWHRRRRRCRVEGTTRCSCMCSMSAHLDRAAR